MISKADVVLALGTRWGCVLKKLFDIYDLEYVISRGYLMIYIYIMKTGDGGKPT